MPRALVVDDSAVVRKVARRLLEERGYEVGEADTASAALALLGADPPGLLLLDWVIPQAAEPELLRQFRGAAAGMRIVVMMDEAELGQVTLALRSGANDVMLKPFDRTSFFDQLGL